MRSFHSRTALQYRRFSPSPDSDLIRKKVELEKEFKIIAQQNLELNEQLKSIHKAIEEKAKIRGYMYRIIW